MRYFKEGMGVIIKKGSKHYKGGYNNPTDSVGVIIRVDTYPISDEYPEYVIYVKWDNNTVNYYTYNCLDRIKGI